ncbi:Histidine kinase-, DNA gyrase B-, and HSP90-like ATPase [Mucilaginibacter gossypiicola]|uniref:Histidine kinase-, DNA gyrase B-, and HSP90-like ATPase n=1 Tax=Mucilaginibacter gossypiicola TaxID=551995 RepID=A0A1H8D974_9SPHI|nr:ATP-binding protein [Mucilaginibacter gossypiicola]SEN03809.1 Histidine kinase-, DNA gyrase B-, and HSP90-like ATPase [Mucilaginibacter gossypiicola]
MPATNRKLNTNGRVVSEILTNYRDTFRAFTELINNSIQESATEIKLYIIINENSNTLYPVIESIELIDNGNGVSLADFDKKILEVGTTVKPGGHGIGRFSALQIGESMKIETVGYDETKSKHSKVEVEITASALKNKNLADINFPTKEEILSRPTNTYYKVSINNLHQNRSANPPKNNRLSEAFYSDNLPAALAQYYIYQIFNGDIRFFVNDKQIERSQFVIDQPILIKKNFETSTGDIHIIDFKLYNIISDLNKVKIFTMVDNAGLKTLANEYTYSSDYYTPDLGTWFIYIESNMFTSDLFKNALLETFGDEDFINLKTLIRDTLNEFFKEKNTAFKDFVNRLKEDKANPLLVNKPVSETHELVFNKVAYLVESKFRISEREDRIKDLVYELVDNSIRNGKIELLFSKLIKMKDKTVGKFHELMERTELESVIHFSSQVAQKLEFLEFLHEITYGSISSVIKERSQLHKIVEKELWLFGENYTQTPHLWSDKKIGGIFDDIRASTLDYIPTVDDDNLVVSAEQEFNDITDLFFYNEKITGDDVKEFMVVELKAPNCKISQKELNQIDRYAFQIEEANGLPTENTRYKLILISTGITAFAKSKVKSAREKYTQPFIWDIKSEKNIEVYVMTWSELIEMNKRKLRYLSSELEIKDKAVGAKFELEYPELLNDKINSQLRFIQSKIA